MAKDSKEKDCKPWDHVSADMDNAFQGNPPTDWTAAKMRNFTPAKLYFIMESNHGGTHDAWARSEIARRQNEQLSCLIGSLAESSGRLEKLTIVVIALTVGLVALTVVLVYLTVVLLQHEAG